MLLDQLVELRIQLRQQATTFNQEDEKSLS